MRSKLHFIIVLFFARFSLFSGQANAQSLTLDVYLAEVLKSNPDVAASKLKAEALERRIGPKSTLDDPFFAVGPDEIPLSNGMGSIVRFQLSQSIPFPGKLGARGGIAKGRAKAATADAETTQRQITVVAIQTFFRTFFNQEAITLNEKLRKLVGETAESTKARYETGDVGHHDWLLARVELSILDVEKLRLEREQRTLHALLNELRNEPSEKEIGRVFLNSSGPVEKTAESKNPELSIDDSPEMKSIDATLRSFDEERRVAKLSYFPDFVFQGMVMTSHGSDPAKWGFMVGINLPLFFWRKQSPSLTAAELDVEATLFDKRALTNRLRTEIVDAQQQLKTAKDIVDLYRKTVIPNTQLAVDNARSGYAARRLSLSQLLDSLKIQRTQELELIAAEIDVEAAKLRLKEVLSAPPILRLAPSRPSLFGVGPMGATGGMSGMGTSETVRMGPGMSGPTRKQSQSGESSASDKSGMGGM